MCLYWPTAESSVVNSRTLTSPTAPLVFSSVNLTTPTPSRALNSTLEKLTFITEKKSLISELYSYNWNNIWNLINNSISIAIPGILGSVSIITTVATAGDCMYTPGEVERNTWNDSVGSGNTSSRRRIITWALSSPAAISTLSSMCIKSSLAVERNQQRKD